MSEDDEKSPLQFPKAKSNPFRCLVLSDQLSQIQLCSVYCPIRRRKAANPRKRDAQPRGSLAFLLENEDESVIRTVARCWWLTRSRGTEVPKLLPWKFRKNLSVYTLSTRKHLGFSFFQLENDPLRTNLGHNSLITKLKGILALCVCFFMSSGLCLKGKKKIKYQSAPAGGSDPFDLGLNVRFRLREKKSTFWRKGSNPSSHSSTVQL